MPYFLKLALSTKFRNSVNFSFLTKVFYGELRWVALREENKDFFALNSEKYNDASEK